MLGSFNSSSSHGHQDQDDPTIIPIPTPSSSPPDLHYHFLPRGGGGGGGGAIHLRQLLLSCAELITHSDFSAAHRLLSFLSANSSLCGDSSERLAHQFTKALSLRLNRLLSASTSTSSAAAITDIIASSAALHSSYLSLNQITPFVRFSHLTANQAILEAIHGHHAVHILDFDIMHGVQWPPLMQAIADLTPPPALRITGTGSDPDLLRRTGDRLLTFARSLGLNSFHFHPLLLPDEDGDDDPGITIPLLPGETLAVNCSLYLHRLLRDNSSLHLRLFLHKLKALNPKIVTVSEREASHNHPLFLHRFEAALDHYRSIFESLEATVPPNSRERLAVEEIWFGREIADVVAAEGERRRERHETFGAWEGLMTSAGFSNVPLSPFALAQAKLLLRLHYPSEGYTIKTTRNSFFLGWQHHPLFSVSSWH